MKWIQVSLLGMVPEVVILISDRETLGNLLVDIDVYLSLTVRVALCNLFGKSSKISRGPRGSAPQ